jgi:ubiquinone biosynthesis UbiH/UbiF/VisC/COQ6 family hydroxylase
VDLVDRDLIIVGGGPVGASLARAAHGLSVALLAHERRVSAPRKERFDARVYALSPANVAFLGLELDRLSPVHAMRVYGDGDSRIEFDAYRAGVAALAYIVEDSALQDALWEGLEPVVGRCEGLEVDEARVRVRLDGARELSGRLVVAADGAESRVREFAGIKVASRAYGQAAVVANFECERAHANVAYQWFQAGPVLALLPLPGAHVSMVWSLPSDEASRVEALEPEALCRELEGASRRVLGGFRLVTPARTYALRRLSARRLVAPRVALAGDAAHVIHPLAGQGLNLGFQDVRTLSRILSAREPVRDAGDWKLLRRYERARAEPILAMDAMVDGLQRFFGAQGAVAGRLRNHGLNLTNRLEVVKNLLIRQAMN